MIIGSVSSHLTFICVESMALRIHTNSPGFIPSIQAKCELGKPNIRLRREFIEPRAES